MRSSDGGAPTHNPRDPLRWMKKAIMAFNIASVTGLIAGGFTGHPLLKEFPYFAILISFSAFCASSLLLHCSFAEHARVADYIGLLSGTLAFGSILSIGINNPWLKWMAFFLPCVFPTSLLLFEMYQLLWCQSESSASTADVEKSLPHMEIQPLSFRFKAHVSHICSLVFVWLQRGFWAVTKRIIK